MLVIGTAGHVDHGKSTLVTALTGIDPDRLKEEKKRQMTIDLGFAWLRSPNGEEIGIIDVPGHLDFIENMIAGVGGISAVLLVIAADEGVMPQTREHLAIISLLRITKGIVVITKCDKVSDDWLEMVEADVKKVLENSAIADANLVRVSATTGYGIEDLKQAIFQMVEEEKLIPDKGKPRLAVDRVFSITGFGTVVTGTLTGGTLQVGNTIQIPRTGKTARIRGLQNHKAVEKVALPGTRTAVNLTGLETNEIHRGDILCLPGTFNPSRRWDAQIEILGQITTGVKHNDLVKVFIHTAEGIGRIRLLEKETLNPGDSGWVQIEFDREMVAEEGDRFIIRRLSPSETLGGGEIANAHPMRRYRLQDKQMLAFLKEGGSHKQGEISLNLFSEHQFLSREMMVRLTGKSVETVELFLDRSILEKRVICLNPVTSSEEIFVSAMYWHRLIEKLQNFLRKYHDQHPLSLGVIPVELFQKMDVPREFTALCLEKLQETGECKVTNGYVSIPGYEVVLTPANKVKVQKYLRLIEQGRFSPPSVKESIDLLGQDLYESLREQGTLIQISADIVFSNTTYQEMADYIINSWGDGNVFTVAEFRDHFQTSRKYALAFLEYQDKKGVTVREGEGRRVVQNTIQSHNI